MSEKELHDGYMDSVRQVCLWSARYDQERKQTVAECVDFYLAAPYIIKLPQTQVKAYSKFPKIFSAIDMRCRLEMFRKYGKKYCNASPDFVSEHSECKERLGYKYYYKEQITCLRNHREEFNSLMRK